MVRRGEMIKMAKMIELLSEVEAVLFHCTYSRELQHWQA